MNSFQIKESTNSVKLDRVLKGQASPQVAQRLIPCIMIQIYNDGKGKADSFEATLIDPETLGMQPVYGLGASPQVAVENLKQAIQQRIALLQRIDYSESNWLNQGE
jgi:hypothetical protein